MASATPIGAWCQGRPRGGAADWSRLRSPALDWDAVAARFDVDGHCAPLPGTSRAEQCAHAAVVAHAQHGGGCFSGGRHRKREVAAT